MNGLTNVQFIRTALEALPKRAVAWVTSFPRYPLAAPRLAWVGRPAHLGRSSKLSPFSNNYLVISSFFPDHKGCVRRRRVQFAALHLAMVDHIGPKVRPYAIRQPFSALVETSPGNCHGCGLIDEPCTEHLVAARLIKGLIGAGLTTDGKDPGIAGVTRSGRLPVGANHKWSVIVADGGPFFHRVVSWTPERCYSVAPVAEAYGIDLSRKVEPRIAVYAPKGAADSLLPCFEALGWYFAPLGNGWHAQRRPWADAHTDGDVSGTQYRIPASENNHAGAFKCFHRRCADLVVKNLHWFIRVLAKSIREAA